MTPSTIHPATVSLAVALALTLPRAASAADRDFEAHWRDGRAEVNGYRLTVSRYRQERTGHAVLIYVTEPFSESKRVKLDDWRKDPADTVDALKLNLVRKFQTGIYDYHTMTSVFARAGDFSPLKISFTSAEWCGHVYGEWLFHPQHITGRYHSYFEGESGPRDLTHPAGGIVEDNLFIGLRGLRGAFLSPGASLTAPYLPGMWHGRAAHQPPAWTTAQITRSADPRTIETPAGSFLVTVYTVKTADGRAGKFFIEQAHPHRVIRWELPPDISAELTGSRRLAYWKLQDERHEEYLEELGLPRPAR
jgi:hypothetical protein